MFCVDPVQARAICSTPSLLVSWDRISKSERKNTALVLCAINAAIYLITAFIIFYCTWNYAVNEWRMAPFSLSNTHCREQVYIMFILRALLLLYLTSKKPDPALFCILYFLAYVHQSWDKLIIINLYIVWRNGLAVKRWTCVNRSWVQYPPGQSYATTLGKLFTRMLPSPSSITWYWSKGGDVFRLGRWPQTWRK